MERLLTAYQEELLSLDELRRRMPDLRQRQREQALQAEFQSMSDQAANRAVNLRLAQTLSVFLERLRTLAQTLDILERQRIVRLLAKEVVVGQDSITIRHCIPQATPSTGGNVDSTGALGSPKCTQLDQSYLLRSGRNFALIG